MPDDVAQIGVTITGTASGINTAAQQAGASIKQLESELRSLQQYAGQGVRGLEGEIDKVTVSLNQARSAATATATAVANSNQAMSATAGAANSAAGAHENLRLATAGTTREFIVLGHEVLTGNFNRIPGSLVVLAERAGSLHTIVEGLISPWGAVGVAGVAALAAIGYAAFEAYEGMKAVEDTAEAMGMKGLGDQTSAAQTELSRLTDKFGESRGQARALMDELNKMAPAAQGFRQNFDEMALSLAQFQHISPQEAIKGAVQATNGGAEAFAKWATQTYNLGGALTESGHNLEEFAKVSASLPDTIDQFFKIAERGGFIKVGADAKAASNEVMTLALALGTLSEGIGGVDTQMQGQLSSAMDRSRIRPGAIATQPGQEYQQQQKDIEAGNTALNRREQLQRQIAGAQARAADDRAALNAGGEPAAQAGIAADLEKAESAARNLQEELRKIHLPDDTAAYDKFRQQSAEQVSIWRNDRQKEIEILRDQAKEAERYAGAGSADAIAAQAKVREAEQRLAREGVQAEIDKQRDMAAAARSGSAERVAAAEEINRQTARRGPSGEPLFSPEQQAGAARAITTAQRAELDQQYRDFKAEKEREIQENRGAIAIINADYAAIRARAAQTNQPQSEVEELARAQVRAQQEAQREVFRVQEESLSAQSRIATAQLGIQRAQLGAEVAAHSIAKSQELTQELQFSADTMAQEESRAAAVLNSIEGTNQEALREREKLNEQLADLYAKDAETQANIQKQITSAIETENKKRAEGFTSLFDSAGSGLERYLTTALTGGSTAGRARQQLVTGLIGDVTKTATGIGSRYLGGQVASAAGVKTSENAGLGEALGLALEKKLGMYQEPPKTTNDHISDLVSTSKGYYDKSIGLLDQIAKNTGHPAGATPGRPSGGASSVDDSTVAALVRKYESGGNYNAGYNGRGPAADLSNAPLNQYGFPQWSGNMGPQGISHAAGAYQFEPKTWEQYAKPMGISDFSPGSQDKVFNAAYADQGIKPWSRNAKLMGEYNAGGGSSGAGAAQQNAQLAQSTQQLTQAQQQATTAQGTASAAISTNAQDLNQDNQALGQHAASAQRSSSAIGGGAGGGGSGLVGGVQQLTGSLGVVSPELKMFSGLLGSAQGIITGFNAIMSAASATTAAASATSAAGTAAKGILGLGTRIFEHGGVVPSAAGGMVTGGYGASLAMLHPNEMVLPAHLSAAVQSAARSSMAPGSMSLAGSRPNFETLSGPRNVTTNSGNNTMTYAPNINGRFGMGKTEVRNILRSHGDAFEATARNMIRNGRF